MRSSQVDSAPEQMLLVAEAALHCNNGLNFGRTGLCTWEGFRSLKLGVLLLLHVFAFLMGSAELPLLKITGTLCKQGPEYLLHITSHRDA